MFLESMRAILALLAAVLLALPASAISFRFSIDGFVTESGLPLGGRVYGQFSGIDNQDDFLGLLNHPDGFLGRGDLTSGEVHWTGNAISAPADFDFSLISRFLFEISTKTFWDLETDFLVPPHVLVKQDRVWDLRIVDEHVIDDEHFTHNAAKVSQIPDTGSNLILFSASLVALTCGRKVINLGK